jgi:putative endonuclease
MTYFVYILLCSDNTLYTGITTNIKRRINEHNGIESKTLGAKYTKSRRPVKLVYSLKYSSRSFATKEEIRIKKLNRIEKFLLIDS